MNRVVFFFSVTVAVAASNLSAPLVGLARDAKGTLHPMHGVAGSFVVRGAIAGDALDWAFDTSGGLMKTANELRALDARGNVIARRSAPSSQVVLNSRYAFFPETGELWRTVPNDRAITIQNAAVGGRVMALGPADQRGIVLAACRAGQLWLLTFDITNGALKHESAPGGEIGEQACRAVNGAALLVLQDRLLLATAHEIVIQTSTGHERRVPIPQSPGAQIHRAGEHSVEIEVSGSPSLLLRLVEDGERLYELPAAETRP
ncbi:MAG TPA: hypothetical protein VMT32_09055 [Bryobacteraceae bacterium]|nr:hypothetical protein [Bryobacteraceae bacterium]